MQPELRQHLDSVASRLRMKRMWIGVASLWGLFAGLVLLAYFGSGEIVAELRPQLEWMLYAVCGLSFLWTIAAFRFTPSSMAIARDIEERFPELDSTLITAVEQEPDFENGGFTFLQQSVINKAAQHALTHEWTLVVSRSQMAFWRSAATLGVVVAFITLAALPSKTTVANNSTQSTEDPTVVQSGKEVVIQVDPGDAEVEKGQSLLVRATFPGRVPTEATLVTVDTNGEEKVIPMAKSLEDPVFGGRIASITTPLEYSVHFETGASETYRVSVFEYPECLRADAELTFPEYTNMQPKTIQDVRRLTAVEGTKVEFRFQLNKSITDGRLIAKNGEEIEILADQSEKDLYVAQFPLVESKRYELHLKDDRGRANKVPPVFHVRVLENRPPDLKVVQPSRDVQVSPLEELELLATVRDDFGVTKAGLDLQIPGQPIQSIEIGTSIPGKNRGELPYQVAFEALNAEPDQLLTYYFWAEDVDAEGQPRRVSSDMFFAEVRPFEEIFRQGQQPPNGQQQKQQQQQQGSQNAQQAEQLAELQKQVINSTWKVIRRETRDKVSTNFDADVEAIRDGQQSALEQLNKLAEKLTDAKSLAFVEETKTFMSEALVSLNLALDNSSPEKLMTALGSEQAAYQSLLKLRAREHEVVQQQQSQQSSKSQQQSKNNRAQQQLQQMNLKDNENRYATENQAEEQEPQQAREDRQVLNRLKELSQRQSDLNERIKELKKDIEEAKTETEKQAAERQLKRLQDEQNKILRDTEELQQRMQKAENQERMQQQQQKMEQVRENVRQASEALEKGMVNRAANEGTRAENELKDLKDEFQKRTSQHFQEKMRDLKKRSEDVKKAEKEIAKALNEDKKDQKGRPSLAETEKKDGVEQAIQKQKEDVKELLEKVRETIEDAEEEQPLLAEELYDTVRDLRKQDPEKALEMTETALSRGFVKEAQEAEKQADEGIERLAKGIDKAAERVLTGDAESLRRAMQEIDQLSDELEGELARATGQPRQDGSDDERSGKQNGSQDPKGENDPQKSKSGGKSQEGENPQDRERNQQQSNESANRNNQQKGESSSKQESQNGRNGQPMPSEQNSDGKGNRSQDSDKQAQGKQSQSNGSPQNPMDGQQPQNQEGQPSSNPSGQSPQQRNSDAQNRQSGQPQTGRQQNSPNRVTQSNPTGTGAGGGIQHLLNRGRRDSKAPIAGKDFMDWSDRLRDVEELVNDPELRAEAARIRDRATEIRKDLKRHSEPPNWDIVREKVAEPLAELQDRVAEELLKLSSKKALVPIDRDPVPPKFDADVRRYYEQLGSSRR